MIVVITLGAILISLAGTPAVATTFYVAPGGNDSNPCSQPKPCLTISHGISVAAGAGNVLYVASGTYTESPTISAGGSAGNLFVVQGFPLGSSCPTTASGTDAYTPMNGGLHPAPTALISGHISIAANYVQLQCFTVYPNPSEQTYQSAQYLPSQAGISITNGQHDVNVWDNYIAGYCIIISNCTSQTYTDGKHAFDEAIKTLNAGPNIDIERNYTNHASAQQTDIYCGTAPCTFKDNEEYGIDVEVSIAHYDGDYNELFGTGTQYIHNYMHGADEAWCQDPDAGQCHIDCFESTGTEVSMLIERNVCFNMNEAVYLWDPCINSVTSNSNASTFCSQGTYNNLNHITVINSIFAFGVGNKGFFVCMDFWHAGDVRWDNNTCWGTGSEALVNSQVTSFENNIQYQTYESFSSNCAVPYGVNINGEWPYTDSSTFTTAKNNILWEDTACTVPKSGLFVNDLRNTNPIWVGPGTYSNTIGANAPNLHLQSSSPAIGAGSNLSSVFSDDLDGNTRPNSPFDIGSYEYRTATNVLPPGNLAAAIN
jgi:hypothetical protein